MAHSSKNSAAIRDLLTAAFSDEELTTLCFDHFRPVYDNYSSGMSKSQKIQLLLDHCVRHDRVETLLNLVRERNPAQHAHFATRLNTSDANVHLMSDVESLRLQLAEAEVNLKLIQERKSQYVLEVDIPLQLIKEERNLLERIAELKRQLGE